MKKILITGSNGLIAQKMLAALNASHEFSVMATSRGANRALAGNYHYESLDITQKEAVATCLEKHRPDVLVHTAAVTQVDPCEQNQEACWLINVTGTENLVRECENYGTHFIHLSSDFVFDGVSGPYHEDSPTNPVNYYGLSKQAAENILRNSHLAWSIIRTTLVHGAVPQMARGNLVFLVKNNLEAGKSIRVADNQFRMPTLAEDLVGGCLEIVKKKAEGIFHISGNDFLSIYEFALIIADVFGLDRSLISPIATEALKEPARRPPKTKLILEKAQKQLHYQPHSLREGLSLVKKQIEPKKTFSQH
jgi:dTDP-4-dehydrorhamnose reductase